MRTVVLGLLAETPVHPGSGRSAGVVDLPVSREAATGYPFVPGSSVKGALRQRFQDLVRAAGGPSPGGQLEMGVAFGTQDKAGMVAVSDARLLLLTVRSLQVPYVWATCPLVLERLSRDLTRAGRASFSSWPAVNVGTVLANGGLGSASAQDPPHIFLEERVFKVQSAGGQLGEVLGVLKDLVGNEQAKARLDRQLAVLADEDFGWFARYGLALTARNVLNDGTKTSENLWYEETLPSDCLMYTLLSSRDDTSEQLGHFLFGDKPYLQLGGNETVGQGWFLVKVLGPAEVAA